MGHWDRKIRHQFRLPRGFWGAVAGKIMTWAPSNREQIDWTLSLLGIAPQDRVLEIGFGPGVAVERLLAQAPGVRVAGIDPSETMLDQAVRRNARAVREGHADLRLASVSCLPPFDRAFDKIFSINAYPFWDHPRERLKELRTRMVPGGLLAVSHQPHHKDATDHTALEEGLDILRHFQDAGLSEVRIQTRPMKPTLALCVLGLHRPH